MTLSVSSFSTPDLPTAKTPPASTLAAQPEAAQAATSTATDVGVSVVITASARALGKDAVSSTPEVDTKKVEAMKAAIQDGSFTVNPEAIADKLLSNAQELLKTTLS